jgi:hypothetical protein
MVWALGNIFITENDDDSAFLIWHDSRNAREKCRWWASWILFSAYFPLFFLYMVWIPLTCYGIIPAQPAETEDTTDTVRRSHNGGSSIASSEMSAIHAGSLQREGLHDASVNGV